MSSVISLVWRAVSDLFRSHILLCWGVIFVFLFNLTSLFFLDLQVFGLLNMVLWGGNIWFVYKDTNLHSQLIRGSQVPGTYSAQRI